ncbi:MAG: hypothetical protein KA734_02990 [Fluviicola sp.]|nr:hypothetical protein [Fluviicola sp.]MBP6270971.1 hypothetical protein [Fluviicola sp.]
MILRLILILTPLISFTQNEVSGVYNNCHSGRSIDVLYQRKVSPQSKFGIGLGCNIITKHMDDNQSNVFKKRLQPYNWKQYITFHVQYSRYFRTKNQFFKPFIGFDVQLKHAPTYTRSFVFDYNAPIEAYGLYVEYISTKGPFTWLSNTFCFGFDIQLSNQFAFTQKAGVGVEMIFGKDPAFLFTYNDPFQIEFPLIYNVGLVYQFKK